MKEFQFYILFFNVKRNEFYRSDYIDKIIDRLQNYYLRNLIIPLGEFALLIREPEQFDIDFYINSAMDDLSDASSSQILALKYFIVPIQLDDIYSDIEPYLKEIELMKQIKE
ncbi:MAG: hypothetical protein KA841_03040 [Chitinophagales bacterium]|nr:hypothetical protein [Chitinophagales bacterium]